MTVFKTFCQVFKKYQGMIILYTVLLIAFGGINMQNEEYDLTFSDSKPDILIVNNDVDEGITANLINYLKERSNIIDVPFTEDKINDALFYRDVNYVIYLPKNYREDVLKGNSPSVKIKSTNDYMASLTEMMLKDYLRLQDMYVKTLHDEEKVIASLNETLKDNTKVVIDTQVSKTETNKMSFYFNFASYSIMAGIVLVICMVLSSFNQRSLRKRTIISPIDYRKYNRDLFLSSMVYALILWLIYIILACLLLGNCMFSLRGLCYILNSLLFTICSLFMALLISTLTNNKDAISGIVNVVALGSSFLCGAFVPSSFLPEFVLKMAHILPTYWYINTNDQLKVMEQLSVNSLKPIGENMIILVLFMGLFIIINNWLTKRKLMAE